MTRHSLKAIAEMSEAEWERAFPDEESCVEWLVTSRWPGDKHCPRCGSDLVFPASLHEYRWRCFGCAPDLGWPFDSRTGTIFQGHPHPLRAWLKALHRELTHRALGYDIVEQKLRRLIRAAMREAAFCRMIGEEAPVPPRIREPDEARAPCNAEETPCPQPLPSPVLLR